MTTKVGKKRSGCDSNNNGDDGGDGSRAAVAAARTLTYKCQIIEINSLLSMLSSIFRRVMRYYAVLRRDHRFYVLSGDAAVGLIDKLE